MKFADLKVGTWLAVAFGAMVVLSVVSAAQSLSKLAAVQDNLENVVKNNNLKIKLNSDMSESVHVVARVMRTVALLDDAAARTREMDKIAKARTLYDAQWTALQKFPASDRAQAARAKIAAAASAARVANDRVIGLAMADKRAEAIPLLMSQAGPATEAWQSAIDDNLAYQEEQNEAQFAEAQAAYAAARNLLLGLNAVIVVLAVALGTLITRGITRALGAEPGEAAELARRVAEGDLTLPIALRQGDTSSMMAQLKAMQGALAAVVAQVRRNSESVSTASAQIAQANHDLSQRTEEQASSLE